MNLGDFRDFHKNERRQTRELPPVLGIPPNVTQADVIQVIEPTSNTYRLDYTQNTGGLHVDLETSRIQRDIDGLAAMEQMIYKKVYTERYEYIIYGWNYGIELRDLFGLPQTFVRAELPRRIREALLPDDRIINIHSFNFVNRRAENKNLVDIGYTVVTIYGDITINQTY